MSQLLGNCYTIKKTPRLHASPWKWQASSNPHDQAIHQQDLVLFVELPEPEHDVISGEARIHQSIDQASLRQMIAADFRKLLTHSLRQSEVKLAIIVQLC